MSSSGSAWWEALSRSCTPRSAPVVRMAADGSWEDAEAVPLGSVEAATAALAAGPCAA
jgi:hypothetical protein